MSDRYSISSELLAMLCRFFGDHQLSFTDAGYQMNCYDLVDLKLLSMSSNGPHNTIWFRVTPLGYSTILCALDAARDRFVKGGP